MKNLIIKDCTVKEFTVEADIPSNIVNNNSSIEYLNISGTGDNFNKNKIFLKGNFENSIIKITSNCTIESSEDFICLNPIIIESLNPITVYFTGNFKSVIGLLIKTPCSLLSTENSIFRDNFNIDLNLNTNFITTNVMISGNFSKSNININSHCNLKLESSINNLNVTSNINNVSVDLDNNILIKQANINSKTIISGDENSIENLKINTIIGNENIEINSIDKIISIEDGIGDTIVKLNNPGNYKISVFVSMPNEQVQIGKELILNVQ